MELAKINRNLESRHNSEQENKQMPYYLYYQIFDANLHIIYSVNRYFPNIGQVAENKGIGYIPDRLHYFYDLSKRTTTVIIIIIIITAVYINQLILPSFLGYFLLLFLPPSSTSAHPSQPSLFITQQHPPFKAYSQVFGFHRLSRHFTP